MPVHDPGDTIPMFDVPKRYRRPKAPPKSDSWRQHSGKRVSCDVCILDLHNGTPDGVLDGARNRLVRLNGDVWYICARHTSDVQSGKRVLPKRA